MKRNKNVKSTTMMRGSLVRWKRKCGNSKCRCAKGQLHESWVLSYSVKSKTRVLALREKDLPKVKAALGRYKKAAEDIEAQALAGIEELSRQIENEKESKRGGR